MTTTMRYTLDNINEILFQGFDYKMPEETLKIISELALQVGSPDYVKTPVFQKRENPMKSETSSSGGGNFKRNNKRNKNVEIVNDEDWEALRTFQTTKIEETVGFDADIVAIRALLNKLSDKNYIDIRNKIIEIIDRLFLENITSENMLRLSCTIFEIASTNRFYSKIYAELFNTIEYIDPKVNYDKFCEINKTNEKRKSLAAFYLNLMCNGIIPKKTIMVITRNLLFQLYTFISEDDKKNEVDELTETVSILYKKEIYTDDEGDDYQQIEGYTVYEIIEKIANSKVKDYKSLTNKSLFKFMDLIDM